MPEIDKIFSSKVKYSGIFPFTDFYKFCYDWLVDEFGLKLTEEKYVEKLSGDSKNMEIVWSGKKKVTDYFQFKVKVDFRIIGLTKVQINQGNATIDSNKGTVEIKMGGVLVRDYDGKFEANAFKKFLRSIYEKWVIASRVDQMEDKLAGDCDEFLSQAKAYLDLSGKR